jgi:hypothetical protein
MQNADMVIVRCSCQVAVLGLSQNAPQRTTVKNGLLNIRLTQVNQNNFLFSFFLKEKQFKKAKRGLRGLRRQIKNVAQRVHFSLLKFHPPEPQQTRILVYHFWQKRYLKRDDFTDCRLKMRGANKPKTIISKNASDHRKRRLKNIGNGIDIDIAAGVHPFLLWLSHFVIQARHLMSLASCALALRLHLCKQT